MLIHDILTSAHDIDAMSLKLLQTHRTEQRQWSDDYIDRTRVLFKHKSLHSVIRIRILKNESMFQV